jgi:CBS domain-containing protein
MLVRELMTTEVVTVEESTPLKEAALLLAERRISGVPVVDADGKVVGVLSEADVLVQERGRAIKHPGLLGLVFDPDAAWREKAGARTVGDAMSSPPIVIGPHRPVHAAASLMLEEDVNRLPVVQHGKLLGIITRADLVRAFVRSDEELREEIADEVFGRALWLTPGRLTVTVEDGVATIFGSLTTAADVQATRELVARVPGIVSVVSHVETETGVEAGAR